MKNNAGNVPPSTNPFPKENRTVPASGPQGSSDPDIVLVMAPPWQTKMVPLGLAYVSSFIRASGFTPAVEDLNVSLFNASTDTQKIFWDVDTANNCSSQELAERFVAAFPAELDATVRSLAASSAPIIGFSTTVASMGVAVYLARRIKEIAPSKIIVCGGPGCYWGTDQIDPDFNVDIFVVGEGELPLRDILQAYRATGSRAALKGIPGTVFNSGNAYVSFLPPHPCKDLEQIPSPDFREFRLEEYNRGNAYRPLPVLISRGCINRCSYCIDCKMNYPFRARKAQTVVDELAYYVKTFQAKQFEFNDLLCNGDLKQLEQICDGIVARKLSIQWTSYAAVREGMTLALCRKMYRAGCTYICYGMESGSDGVLKAMNKRYSAALAEKTLRNTHNAGIRTGINIILGHPGESEREFRNTCRFIVRNRGIIDYVTNISSCFLMHGSDMMADHAKYGIYFKRSPKDWLRCLTGDRSFTPNYRQFHAAPDNTPAARARRVRRFIRLLHRIHMPRHIINRVIEDDRSFERFLDGIPAEDTRVAFGPCALDFAREGKVQIAYKDAVLTANVGMNTSFQIGDAWTDSSFTHWCLRASGKARELYLVWIDYPLTQRWVMRPVRDGWDWDVVTTALEPVTLRQIKAGIMLDGSYDRYSVSSQTGRFPAGFGAHWQDVCKQPSARIAVGTDGTLPSIFFENRDRELCALLQNAPQDLRSRMIHFCLGDPASQQTRSLSAGDTLRMRLRVRVRPVGIAARQTPAMKGCNGPCR